MHVYTYIYYYIALNTFTALYSLQVYFAPQQCIIQTRLCLIETVIACWSGLLPTRGSLSRSPEISSGKQLLGLATASTLLIYELSIDLAKRNFAGVYEEL